VKFINKNVYSHDIIEISGFLNTHLHDFVGSAYAINLTIFFCEVNIFFLLYKLPPKISDIHYEVKNGPDKLFRVCMWW
jgi:hypothetical protein